MPPDTGKSKYCIRGIAASGQKPAHVRKALPEIKTEYGEKYPKFTVNESFSVSGKPKSNDKFIKNSRNVFVQYADKCIFA